MSVGLREYMHRRRFTPEKRTYEELWLQETDPTPGKRLDLTGQRYGRLVVLGPAAELTEKRKVRWSKVDRPKVIARIVRAG